MGKIVNRVKLAVLSDSEPLQWEKIGKVLNRAKLAILSDLATLVGKDWESCKLAKIGCSKCKKPKFFAKPNSNFALLLTKISHYMNTTDILVKL